MRKEKNMKHLIQSAKYACERYVRNYVKEYIEVENR